MIATSNSRPHEQLSRRPRHTARTWGVSAVLCMYSIVNWERDVDRIIGRSFQKSLGQYFPRMGLAPYPRRTLKVTSLSFINGLQVYSCSSISELNRTMSKKTRACGILHIVLWFYSSLRGSGFESRKCPTKTLSSYCIARLFLIPLPTPLFLTPVSDT